MDMNRRRIFEKLRKYEIAFAPLKRWRHREAPPQVELPPRREFDLFHKDAKDHLSHEHFTSFMGAYLLLEKLYDAYEQRLKEDSPDHAMVGSA
jgi:hypothetical protein